MPVKRINPVGDVSVSSAAISREYFVSIVAADASADFSFEPLFVQGLPNIAVTFQMVTGASPASGNMICKLEGAVSNTDGALGVPELQFFDLSETIVVVSPFAAVFGTTVPVSVETNQAVQYIRASVRSLTKGDAGFVKDDIHVYIMASQ
jgi:hypothetical protein